MEEQIPRSWIGQDLVLHRTEAASWELITLKQVSELGLAYAYKDGEIEEVVFVPWHAVAWLRPPVAGDLEDTEPEE